VYNDDKLEFPDGLKRGGGGGEGGGFSQQDFGGGLFFFYLSLAEEWGKEEYFVTSNFL